MAYTITPGRAVNPFASGLIVFAATGASGAATSDHSALIAILVPLITGIFGLLTAIVVQVLTSRNRADSRDREIDRLERKVAKLERDNDRLRRG